MCQSECVIECTGDLLTYEFWTLSEGREANVRIKSCLTKRPEIQNECFIHLIQQHTTPWSVATNWKMPIWKHGIAPKLHTQMESLIHLRWETIEGAESCFNSITANKVEEIGEAESHVFIWMFNHLCLAGIIQLTSGWCIFSTQI